MATVRYTEYLDLSVAALGDGKFHCAVVRQDGSPATGQYEGHKVLTADGVREMFGTEAADAAVAAEIRKNRIAE